MYKEKICFSVRYFYTKLKRFKENKIKQRLAKLNSEIELVTGQIEYLSLIRDNNLELGVYERFVNGISSQKRDKKRRRQGNGCRRM